jgi:hypothetical protein
MLVVQIQRSADFVRQLHLQKGYGKLSALGTHLTRYREPTYKALKVKWA